jgi:hypothetical protein
VIEETNTIQVTIYLRPNRRRDVVELLNIYPDDAKYINDNNIKVSLEEMANGTIIIYFDRGFVDDEGEPIEHIELSNDSTSHETIKKAVITIKKLKEHITPKS